MGRGRLDLGERRHAGQATESREYITDLYRLAWKHSDESIALLPLDAPASVGWWPEHRRQTTFGHLLTRVVAETAQHAGHCDVVRELIDGRSGADNPDGYYDLVLREARAFPVES